MVKEKKQTRLGTNPLEMSFIRNAYDEGEDTPGKPSKQETTAKQSVKDVIPDKPSKQKNTPVKRGRPPGPPREVTSKSQVGLPEGWTRATFIVREDLLTRIKDYAYWERLQTKQVVNTAIETFLKGKHIKPRPNP